MSFTILPFDGAKHHDKVVDLWKRVFGYGDARNDPALAIEKKRLQGDDLFWVAEADDEDMVGTVMAGYDGHRGWIYSLAVSPYVRKNGLGTQLLETAEAALTRLGCMKINLQILEGNREVEQFYQKAGYTTEPRISMGKEIKKNIRSTSLPDHELLRQFEDLSLPHSSWTHRAHLKVAFLYLRDNPFDIALKRMRSGIQTYNAANQVEESQFSGYNETTTHAFLRIVQATMKAYGDIFPTPDADSFCDTHPQLQTKHLMRLFYTPERRRHPDAKEIFVEPDLTNLPVPPAQL